MAVLLALCSTVPAQGVELRGTVVAARLLTPLPDVEVGIPALGLSTRSDSAGAFLLPRVPVGTHRVTARRVGYNAVETEVRVGVTAPAPLRLILLSLQQLDSVTVVAGPLDNALREFEEHRRIGLGKFLTRESLVRYDGMKLSSVLPQLSSVSLIRAGQQALIVSRRSTTRGTCGAPPENPRSMGTPAAMSDRGQPNYSPTRAELARGVKCACYAQVYVDGVLQNPTRPADPFDVNSIPVDDVEGVEWYAGPSQTPVEYTRLNSTCGVLVIHTRRANGRFIRPSEKKRDSVPPD